jgi:hypothetical protein
VNIIYKTLFLIIMISSSSAISTYDNLSQPKEEEPIIFTQTSSSFKADYFLGDWTAEGYTCFGAQPPNEYINISHQNGKFVATKTLGDPCVPTNHITFDGVLSSSGYSTGTNYDVNVRTGNQSAPSSGSRDTSIQIIDENHFKANMYNLHYYRKALPAKAAVKADPRYFEFLPARFFEGKWYVEGLGCSTENDGLCTIQDEVTLSYTTALNEFVAKRNNGDIAFKGNMYDQKSHSKRRLPIIISNNDYRNMTITNQYSKLILITTDLIKVDSWNVLFTRVKRLQ